MSALRSAARAARHRWRVARTDLVGRRRYGREAPRYAERVVIDPTRCDETVVPGAGTPDRSFSGVVVGGDWDRSRAPIRTLVKVDACYLRWEDSLSWEETGVYDYLLGLVEERPGTDGCFGMNDIVARYARLDEMFAQITNEGRLRSAREFSRGRREEGGVLVHFDRTGQVLFGGGGMHRLAAARIAGLRSIPAQVGAVHPAGIGTWRD